MALLRITGNQPLHGELTISGRKNAALKLIAATLLSEGETTLHRVPDIGDVRTMFEILKLLGATVTPKEEGTFVINTSGVNSSEIPYDLGRKLRASLVLVGPLLARFGKATFPHPGGCVIGKRTIAPHLLAFEQLGAHIDFDGTTYVITSNQLRGQRIHLKEQSVTGTENLLMAAVRAEGTTEILHAAEESHINNLADLLRAMGYGVSGDGTTRIIVNGSHSLSTTHAEATIIPDEIEVGTFAAAALVTKGEITLHKVGTYYQLAPILSKMDDFNAKYHYHEDTQTLQILPSPNLTATNIQSKPWPGFPPDLESPFAVVATQAEGTSLLHDWMYEGRLYFTDLLTKMGANITICDPHRAIITGPTPLQRSALITPDLRAGAAFVVAALAADGESTIEHVELIDRGYDQIDTRLRTLGAVISRE